MWDTIRFALLSLALLNSPAFAQEGTISVKQYGALGVGTDDTKAILAAIAAAANSPAHPPLYFPPGIYKVSQSLDIPSSVTIVKGAGHNSSKIVATGAVPFRLLTFDRGDGNEGVQIQDLYLDCAHIATDGLLLGLGANAYVANNVVARCTDAALVLDAVQNATILSNDFRESRVAAKVLNGTGNSVFLRNEHELTGELILFVGKDSSYPSFVGAPFDGVPTQNTFGPGNVYADGGTYATAISVQEGSANLWTANNMTAGSGALIVLGANATVNRFSDNKVQMGSNDLPVVDNAGFMNGFRGDIIQVRAAPNPSCTVGVVNKSVLVFDKVSVNDDCFFQTMSNSPNASTFVTSFPTVPYK